MQKTFSTTNGKSQSNKRIKYYYFVLLSFCPLTGDFKGYKRRSIHFIIIHTLALALTVAEGRFSLVLEEKDIFVVMP